MSKLIIPGLRKRHLAILGLCAYTLQAIASADGPFRLNHSLFFATSKNGQAGWVRLMSWMDNSADSIDRWSAERFGKDPWTMQGEVLARYTKDCVTAPKPGQGYLSAAKISIFHNSKSKDIRILGTPYCKRVSGTWIYLTIKPDEIFEVNPRNPKDYGYGAINP